MNPAFIKKIVAAALVEDLGKGDITTNSLVPTHYRSSADLIAKSGGVVCGLVFAAQAFRQLDGGITFKTLVREGQKIKPGTKIVLVHGSTRALLSGERVAVNFLSYLSGVASQTRAFVAAVKPYKVIIMDTRKTTPLFRLLERYAVKVGGGVNHRFDLSTMPMIKDNHIASAAGKMNLQELVTLVRSKTKKKVELEVESLRQFKEGLLSGADILLLDNMTPAAIRQAVHLRNQAKSKILLEASGGIRLHNVRAYAKTGVERISVGGLTHTRQPFDISMEFAS